MTYPKGTSVKIKTGVKVEDIPLNIEGWQGRIGVSEYQDAPEFICIELDSIVINSLPEGYIIETLRQAGISCFHHFYLEKKDIEPAIARDTEADVNTALEEIERKYAWKAISDGSPEDELIAELMADEGFEGWFNYLDAHLTFPFEAEATSDSRYIGSRFKVTSFLDEDDMYGIIIQGKEGRHSINFELCNLEVTDKASENYTFVRAYVVWFANQ